MLEFLNKTIMKIKKQLKNVQFEYDEETKTFRIIDAESGGAVELNKVYAFAFMRFVVRMAQRNWLRPQKKLKKIVDISPTDMVSLEDNESHNPKQMLFKEIKDEENLGIQS